jgi:hypothetical protein
MTMTTSKNRLVNTTADQSLVDGLTKHASALPPLLILGKTISVPDAVAVLQGRLTTAKTVVSNRATWENSVKADADERASTQAFVSALKQALQTAFATQVDTLADFGLKARKPRTPLTTEEMAVSIAKNKATRAARHTVGPAVKAKIKGVVPTATPAPSPAAPSPALAPSQATAVTVPAATFVTAPAATTAPKS